MNKLSTILCFFICSICYSQAPQKINYQAVVRDANGNIIPNTSVPITISVVNGINSCSVYNGNQTTNSYGLISLELDLSACTIDWSTGTATLSSSINNVSGTSNLNSVPYSLHANTVTNYPSTGISDGDILVWDATNSTWVAQSSSSTNGINCWDTNGDGVNDSSEDTNNDGAWNALDCAGADGADGNDGADGTNGVDGQDGADGTNGMDGTNGINCWDTNGDGVNDSSEDINNDGAWNALDCVGADGADGNDGADGTDGVDGQDGADGTNGVNGNDGTNGINCWDTNGDGVNDSSEDTNNDGAWNALDCAGADGADGNDGADGTNGLDGTDGTNGVDGNDGADGINCWDTNGDGVNDSSEDSNGDGSWDALDCQSNNSSEPALIDVILIGNDAGNNNITNLADPINSQDAVTKFYVDDEVAKKSSYLTDTDDDTKIQVEEILGEDIIRFDTDGQERMTIDNNGNISLKGDLINESALQLSGFDEINFNHRDNIIPFGTWKMGDISKNLDGLNDVGQLKLYNNSGNFVALSSRATNSNSTYYLPPTPPGGAGAFLTSDISGILTWEAPSDYFGTINSGNSGKIAYYSGNGKVISETSDLYWSGLYNRLGVGLSDPTYKLEVDGDVGFNDYIYHNDDPDTKLFFDNDEITLTAGGENLLTLTKSTQDIVKMGDGGDVDINLNDNIFIEGNSGNIGIGNTSPNYKLDVSGTAGFDEYLIHKNDNDTKLHFNDDNITLISGGKSLLTLTESTQDIIQLGDGTDIDININDALFINGEYGDVSIDNSVIFKSTFQRKALLWEPTLNNEELFATNGTLDYSTIIVDAENAGPSTILYIWLPTVGETTSNDIGKEWNIIVRNANFNTIKVKWGSSNWGNGIGGSNSVSMTQSYEKITVVLVDYYNGSNYYSLHKAQQP